MLSIGGYRHVGAPITENGSYIDNLTSTPYRPWETVAYGEGERYAVLTVPWPLPNSLQHRRLHCLSSQNHRWVTASLAHVRARHSAACVSPITGIVAHNRRGYGRLSHITEARSAWPSDRRRAKRQQRLFPRGWRLLSEPSYCLHNGAKWVNARSYGAA